MSENQEAIMSEITTQHFYTALSKKVSGYNAKLLLNSAMIQVGFNQINADPLKLDDAKNICLELIKKGGPAFYVGKEIYQQIQ
ncbi:MAG: hypothetical protein MK008_04130 [Bdellovibrionales bacterium]|nr:hypothetical protein [Bdellovibrionales bacterium]